MSGVRPAEPADTPAVPCPFEWAPRTEIPTLRRPVRSPGQQRWTWQHEEAGRSVTPFHEVHIPPTGGLRTLFDRGTRRVLLTAPRTSGLMAGLIDGRAAADRQRLGRARVQTAPAFLSLRDAGGDRRA